MVSVFFADQTNCQIEDAQVCKPYATMTYSDPTVDILAHVYKRTRRAPIVPEYVYPKTSTLLYCYDDPDRTAFFLPLTILLLLHMFFLLHVYFYAPNPEGLFIK